MAPSVYILLHHDTSSGGTPTILSVFSDLTDANTACLQQAIEANVETGARSPRDLQRWESAEGVVCWVEKHTVVPRKTAASRPSLSPKRKDSRLYDDDEDDDAIEVVDKDESYD
ncbi:hypothetical protein BGZ63DRAFT_403370 [Mariannaea sp. PMI_226]|nr:hypothetical protein BGZ63DRAFT_403370 [Mariannaea sp. PMI_226]